jgi:hypothetical protein
MAVFAGRGESLWPWMIAYIRQGHQPTIPRRLRRIIQQYAREPPVDYLRRILGRLRQGCRNQDRPEAGKQKA